MEDEIIANYIGYAIILLTADHLGVEVEMLDIAKMFGRQNFCLTIRCWDATPRLPIRPAKQSSPRGSATKPTVWARYST